MSLKYRLGIDMGSTSLGWCLLELDEKNNPCGIKKMGVRIFPDGRDDKSKDPLSVARREKRGARRNHDRFSQRLSGLIEKFTEIGFLPADEEERRQLFLLDPYMLRVKGLDEKLTTGEIARAIIHLSKRRGFLSNRKTDNDKETSDFKDAIKNLAEQLERSGARTLGEYLCNRSSDVPENQHHLKQSIRFRYEKNLCDEERIFPRRDMVIDEFNKLWDKQTEYHSDMTTELKEDIHQLIFYQRPLKAQIPGKCIFEEDEDRACKAYPIFQEFRLLQFINDLKIIDVESNESRDLSVEEKSDAYEILQSNKSVKFDSLRRKLFGKQAADYRLNFEYQNRDKILGNETNALFNERKNQDLKKIWDNLEYEGQKNLIEILISERLDDDEAIGKMKTIGIDSETAERFLYLKLPGEHGDISIKALEKIVPFMKEGLKYSEACTAAGYDHSKIYSGEIFNEGDLPYYGSLLKKETLPLQRETHDQDADEYGKINNPTVHIALNQVRKLVNAVAKKYGAPQQIAIELARDLKMSKEHKEKLNKELGKKTKNNERIAKELEILRIPNNGENRARFKLWEELAPEVINRCCVYSGRQISVERLFSEEFEIEHILPKSRTFDDSTSNKTISHYTANRYKGERSPYEAFGDSPDGYDWETIVARANKLPKKKAKRFLKDAMKDFSDENKVIARMLNDTRYMSRTAKKYLSYVCGDNNVYAVTGQQTAILRGKWGLNKTLNTEEDIKNRDDHRHHAIDAFVIAMTSRSFIQRYASTIRNSRERFIEKLELPWEGFNHEKFSETVNSIDVSFKPDQINTEKLRSRNQTAGPLFEETAYSYISPDPDNVKYDLYSVRKNITDISVKNIDNIKSPEIRRWVAELNGDNKDDKMLKAKLKKWGDENNVSKVKLIVKFNPKGMIQVYNERRETYKYFSSKVNLFCDIYQINPSEPESKWGIEVVSYYNAHQPGFIPEWKQDYPMAKKIMRLFKNDIVALDDGNGERELRRVREMSGIRLYLRKLSIAVKPKDKKDIGEAYYVNKLRQRHARKAGIDILGRVFDPIVNEE